MEFDSSNNVLSKYRRFMFDSSNNILSNENYVNKTLDRLKKYGFSIVNRRDFDILVERL